jgi:hypothetical protein
MSPAPVEEAAAPVPARRAVQHFGRYPHQLACEKVRILHIAGRLWIQAGKKRIRVAEEQRHIPLHPAHV